MSILLVISVVSISVWQQTMKLYQVLTTHLVTLEQLQNFYLENEQLNEKTK